jgi:hypothetical protein
MASERYEALVKEHGLVRERFKLSILQVQSESANQDLCDAYEWRLQWLARCFMDLAQENPHHPIALDAVAWVASHVPSAAVAGDVLRVLSEHPGQKDRIRSICQRLTQADSPVAENVLRLADSHE